MISAKTRFAYITISFSAGYFIYDAIDIIKTNKKMNSAALEVLLHHFIVAIQITLLFLVEQGFVYNDLKF